VTAATVALAIGRMSRPGQLLLVVAVFAVGVVAGAALNGGLDRAGVAWALAALVPAAVSVHVVNEYADRDTDALTRRTAFSGGSGALGDLGLDRAVAWWAAVAAAAVAVAVAGAGLVLDVLPPVVAGLLVAGLAGGWQYSVGPLRLSRRGWGEVANALLGGLLLPVYGVAAATGRVGVVDVLVFLPFALLDFVNLLETQWPDRVADRRTGKRTLVTRVPARTVRLLTAGATVLAYATAVAVLCGLMLGGIALASLVALPLSVWAVVRIARVERPLPGVLAMLTFLLTQGAAWTALATS
jgi:1,4-dihydroxy-2-naphthoate octaprenyltransferase